MCVSAPDEVTMEEVGQAAQLRAGELIIIVVVLVMWAGTVPVQQRTSITTELQSSVFGAEKALLLKTDKRKCTDDGGVTF